MIYFSVQRAMIAGDQAVSCFFLEYSLSQVQSESNHVL